MIRIITAADVDTFLSIIQEARPGLADAMIAAGLFNSTNPFVIIGDPTVPVLVRLERYRITDATTLGALPPALRAGIVAASGFSVQITDFYPLPIGEAGGPAKVAAALKLLASVLREGSKRYPVLRQQPVWAQFSVQLVNFMKNGLPAAGVPAPFPNAGTSGRLIWHTKFIDAALAVDSLAVDVS